MADGGSVLHGEGVLVGEVDEAEAGEHQGDEVKLPPKLIDPRSYPSELSTSNLVSAAMALTARPSYGFIEKLKMLMSKRGYGRCSQCKGLKKRGLRLVCPR